MPLSLPPEISKRLLFTQPHQHRGLSIFGIFTNLISEKLNLVFRTIKIWFLFSLNLLFSICSVDPCFVEPTRPEIAWPPPISLSSSRVTLPPSHPHYHHFHCAPVTMAFFLFLKPELCISHILQRNSINRIYCILGVILASWVLQKQIVGWNVYVHMDIETSLSLSLNHSVHMYFKELAHTIVKLTGLKFTGQAGHLSRS